MEDTRLELGGGILALGVMIDTEFYLLCTKVSVAPVQEIKAEPDEYVQGGDFTSIANIGPKKIEGTLSFPLLLESDGSVNPAVKRMLEKAQHPDTPLSIDTNFTYTHLGLTAESEATDNNALIAFDCCVIKKLTLSCQEKGKAEITATILGMIDSKRPSAFVDVTDAFLANSSLRRVPDYRDCDAFRENSELRSVTSIEITLENRFATPCFIPPLEATAEDRSEQINLIVPTGRKWSGGYTERIPRRWGRESYAHGGWMVNQNLVLAFGPVESLTPHPLFDTSTQDISATQNERAVKFTSIQSPGFQGDMFTFLEERN